MTTTDADSAADTDQSAAERAERTTAGLEGPTGEQPGNESLGWRGWVVVAALVLSMAVIPWTIVFLPEAQWFLTSIGLGWRDAYLVLPLLPAMGLGFLAVWAAVANRR